MRQVLNELKVKIYYCRRNLVTIKYTLTLILTVNINDSNKNTSDKKKYNYFEIKLFLSLLNLIRLTG